MKKILFVLFTVSISIFAEHAAKDEGIEKLKQAQQAKEKATTERSKAYLLDLEIFEKQIEGKIAELESPKFNVREEALKALEALLYAKKLPEERRDILLKLMKKNIEVGEKNPSKAELVKNLKQLLPKVKWEEMTQGIGQEIAKHPRLTELRNLLDFVLGKFTDAEKEKYLSMLKQQTELQEKVNEMSDLYTQKVSDYFHEKQEAKEAKKDEKKITVDIPEAYFKDLKATTQKLTDLEKEKQQWLVKTLQAKGVKISEYELEVPKEDVKSGGQDDSNPPVKDATIEALDKKFDDSIVMNILPELRIIKDDKKYAFVPHQNGSFEIGMEEIKDEVNPLKDYIANAKEHVFLPGDLKAKDIKSMPVQFGMTGALDNPAYVANYTFEREFPFETEEDEEVGEKEKDKKKEPEMVQVERKMQNTRKLALDIFQIQFTEPKALDALENYIEKIGPMADKLSIDYTIFKSDLPAMKSKPIDKENLPLGPDIFDLLEIGGIDA